MSNSGTFDNEIPIFKSIQDKTNFYFVHSYRAALADLAAPLENKFPNYKVTETIYANDFISSVWNGENLFACQFHPEKSGEAGLRLLGNFAGLDSGVHFKR